MAVDVTVQVGVHIRCPMDERDVAVTNREIDEILIYYSSSHWQEMLSAAKALAQALGLTVTDTGAIGCKPVQKFNWTVDRSGYKEIALMEVRMVHRQGIWTVYFHLSRQRYKVMQK
jgi:hypothetical protein